MFGWFKARRQRVEDARAILFEEYGLRPESSGMLASFDPFNLALQAESAEAVEPELQLIMDGKLDEAKAIVAAKLPQLNDRQRLDYAREITAGIHELRHFHDHFFTTFGFDRIMRIVEDAIDFNRLWDALKKEPVIKLPLAKWAKQHDAPQSLRDYMERRQQFVEWFKLHDGALPSYPVTGQQDTVESLILIDLKGLQTKLPGIVRNEMREATGEKWQLITPLGGQVLMEGAALIVQRTVIKELFGEDVWQSLKYSLSRGQHGDDSWKVYMAVDLYLTKHLKKFYTRYQLALTDIAMMPPDGGTLEEIHPGWRMSALAKKAADLGSIHQQPGADLVDYMDNLTKKLGWPTVGEVTAAAIAKSEKFLSDTDSHPEKQTLWLAVLRTFTRLHLTAMKARQDGPTVLAEPFFYLGVQSVLPPAPVRVRRSQIEFRGLDNEAADAMRAWFNFEHFHRQMLFSDALPCPGRRVAHACPGDPLKRRWFAKRWAKMGSCSASQLIALLGVPDQKFKRA